MKKITFIGILFFTFSSFSLSAMNHSGMIMDAKGMVMNSNPDKLPKDCKKISEDVHFTVHAGHKYAKKFNGKMYAFDQQQWDVKPCSRIKITFINDDNIRHQFMIHGLPGYLYPKGMFHIELYGKGKKEGYFIVPSQPKTYLVHCEVPQHMEKGMKAQLKVAGGDQDLPSIPGVTEPVTPDSYEVSWNQASWAIAILSVLVGFAVPFFLMVKYKKTK